MRFVASALLVLVLIGTASSQTRTPPYVDVENGIAVQPPDKWDCIPTPKEVKYKEWMAETKTVMIAKWQAKLPDADNYSLTLELYQIKDSKDLEAAVAAYTAENSGRGRDFDVKKRQDFFIAGKLKARLLGVSTGRGFYHVVGIFSDGAGKAFAMEFTCGAARAEKYIPDWLAKYLQTFTFLSAKDIEKLKKHGPPPLMPGWQVYKTAHYDVQYNCDAEFARTIGTQLEAILLEYQRHFPLDSFGGGPVTEEGHENKPTTQKTTLERMTVKLFKDDETFQSYAAANGVGGAAAYFSPMQNELAGYKTVAQGKGLSIHIFYHEGMHQYLHALFGEDVDIPIWINEGMAEYFFGGEFQADSGKFIIGLNKERIDTIRQAARDGSFVPLKKIFKYTQAQYYANAGLCYAEGWSIAYFLWETKDEKYKGVIETFMKTLRQTKDADKAFEASFGKLDLDQLEKDWQEFVIHKM